MMNEVMATEHLHHLDLFNAQPSPPPTPPPPANGRSEDGLADTNQRGSHAWPDSDYNERDIHLSGDD